jgi:hypothetical protein
LPPDLKPIRDFYAVWIALEKKDQANAQSCFEHWKNALQQLRAKGKDQQSPNWSFTGAKIIWKQRHLPESDFYLGMIKSMEDPQADFPMFPPGL